MYLYELLEICFVNEDCATDTWLEKHITPSPCLKTKQTTNEHNGVLHVLLKQLLYMCLSIADNCYWNCDCNTWMCYVVIV